MATQLESHWPTLIKVAVVAWVAAMIIWSGVISSRAFAASSKPSTLNALHAAAQKIAEGKVIAQSVRWENGRIVTRSIVSIRECFKGKCGKEIEIKQFGGSRDGLTMVAHGVTVLKQGEAAFVFVTADGPSSYQPVAMGNGVLRSALHRDVDTLRTTLRNLKNAR